ncbi:hypothetical protein H5410_029296 [Solanum commersonii]|uniref:Uncharacterized protein n=1 Tax=Solanum commersonii TaxID=4109 RepID=A0A9J5Z8L1_SOLCO|nr:hypothetical protein H5410_029296 [Solanum commersonii]
MELVGFHGQNIPFSRSNEPRISYGASWPSWPKHPIFKVKQALEQSIDFLVIWNFELIFAKKICSHPLRPYLWIQLALMAKPSHLKVKRAPEQLWSQLALSAKISHFEGQTSTRAASWPSRPIHPIFKVKSTPDQLSIKILAMDPVSPHSNPPPPPFCQFLCAIVHGLFGDLEF